MRTIKTTKEIMRQLVLGKILAVSENNKVYVLLEDPSPSLCDDLQIYQIVRFNKNGELENRFPLDKFQNEWFDCSGDDLRNWFWKV